MKYLLLIFLGFATLTVQSQNSYKTIDIKILDWNARISYIPYNTDSTTPVVVNVVLGELMPLYGFQYWLEHGWDGGIKAENGTHYPPMYINMQKGAWWFPPRNMAEVSKSLLAAIRELLNVKGEILLTCTTEKK